MGTICEKTVENVAREKKILKSLLKRFDAGAALDLRHDLLLLDPLRRKPGRERQPAHRDLPRLAALDVHRRRFVPSAGRRRHCKIWLRNESASPANVFLFFFATAARSRRVVDFSGVT